MVRIGYLASADPAASPDLQTAFRTGLREFGYVEGRNMQVEYRWTDGTIDRLPARAAELVRLKVDLIFAWATPAVLAAKQATTTVPIVFVGVADPVGAGIVASLARPGGNVTGVSNISRDLTSKHVELLAQIIPGITQFAVIRHSANPSSSLQLQEAQSAAQSLGLQVRVVDVASAADLDTAFATIAKERIQGVIVFPDPMMITHRKRIADGASRNRLPTIFARQENAEAGGLVSYGPSLPDQFRVAVGYVDKILKGAKPGDLPVEQPTKLDLALNLKTAKALGIAVSASLLIRADTLIQ